MTFFNATLILGTLAAVVPIALHLLARREPQRVVFPGVQFLRPKLSSQRSRLRIRRWWLLALRVLAVIALAVALARPHIDSAMSSTWWTVGLMGLTGVGFLILASVAVARGMGRSLAVGVAVAGLLALLGSLFLGTRTWATSGDLSEGNEQPVAMALLIDNGPSSKRLIASSDGTNSSRLENAIREAATVIERLPDGSRLVVLDRSATPIGFALDAASARLRLSQMKPLANPLPVQERMDAAIELLRSSDLPGKQLARSIRRSVLARLSDSSLAVSAASRAETTDDSAERIRVFALRTDSLSPSWNTIEYGGVLSSIFPSASRVISCLSEATCAS